MLKIVFTVPDEIEAFIRDEMKQEPQTYIQNELVEPIITKYAKRLKESELQKTEKKVDKDVAKTKNEMKVELNNKEVKQ